MSSAQDSILGQVSFFVQAIASFALSDQWKILVNML